MEKTVYRLPIQTEDGRRGVGECAPMPALSPEAGTDCEERLRLACEAVNNAGCLPQDALADAPSLRFGIETALLSARAGGGPLFDTPFSRGETGLAIHCLIWMDEADAMLERMAEGVAQGFTCLKLKVGFLPWPRELAMLREAHAAFPGVEIRVDANGAFLPEEALDKLTQLAEAGVSCIEQPLRPRQWDALATLISRSPLPIALDEELAFARSPEERSRLLDFLHPHALVIKPSLHGGISGAEDWARQAENRGARWWINSALEGAVGLAALADWCAWRAPGTLHGLGTGRLFANDIPGAVRLEGCLLRRPPSAQA